MISTVSQLKLFKRKPEGYLGLGENGMATKLWFMNVVILAKSQQQLIGRDLTVVEILPFIA